MDPRETDTDAWKREPAFIEQRRGKMLSKKEEEEIAAWKSRIG
jgi:hypothetical protein